LVTTGVENPKRPPHLRRIAIQAKEAPMDFSLFPRDLFAEMDRLQRQMQQALEFSPSIRGFARGGFPALNVASTEDSAEVYAFAPGLDPASINVQVERGVLSVSGERPGALPSQEESASVHLNERFAGRFHRVVTLTDDLDPNHVQANYRNGVLHISIRRRESAKPRRISVN
jgi:HSP20 family protein